MYTIGHVIYGAPVNKDIQKVAENRDEELDSEDGGYFTDLYNGGGGPSGFIGVELASFDECDAFLLSDITQDLTIEQSAETAEKLSNLPLDYRMVLPPVGIWVVWSTS
jgi:hypothetical protein